MRCEEQRLFDLRIDTSLFVVLKMRVEIFFCEE